MSTLHLGSRNPSEIIELLPDALVAFVERDQWEEWGEHNAEDRQYHGVHHVIIRSVGMTPADSADLLADLAWIIGQGATLEPMRGPEHQAGIVACITLDDEWSESLLNIRLGRRGLDDHARLTGETLR